MYVHRKVLRVNKMVNLNGSPDNSTRIIGTVVPVVLECGHILYMNPIYDYRNEKTMRCGHCEDEAR